MRVYRMHGDVSKPQGQLETPPEGRTWDQDLDVQVAHHGSAKASRRTAEPISLDQPQTRSISYEQLACEVRGIYDGIASVKAKCIDLDDTLVRDTTKVHLEQWQSLIVLHRTLLYEHHDFLMATQHPSATESPQSLVTGHSVPARMWKHGIHAFLEVLRHRRPNSHDYMLAFVVLAYQMIALLHETVPCFKDTWIECLGISHATA